MDINEIRRTNARILAKGLAHGKKGISAFAHKIGRSQPQVTNIIGDNPTTNIGSRVAREIEAAFKKPHGWLDSIHGPIDSAPADGQIGDVPGYDLSDPKDLREVIEITVAYCLMDGLKRAHRDISREEWRQLLRAAIDDVINSGTHSQDEATKITQSFLRGYLLRPG